MWTSRTRRSVSRPSLRRPPVMSDVGRLAGVSHQTVSRVINGSPNVRPETRRRVIAAMRELGYRPNSVARALVTGRTNTLGVVGFDTTLYGPASTLFGIERAAHEAGYFMIVASLKALNRSSVAYAIERLRGTGRRRDPGDRSAPGSGRCARAAPHRHPAGRGGGGAGRPGPGGGRRPVLGRGQRDAASARPRSRNRVAHLRTRRTGSNRASGCRGGARRSRPPVSSHRRRWSATGARAPATTSGGGWPGPAVTAIFAG